MKEYVIDLNQDEVEALRIALGACSGHTIYYTYGIFRTLVECTNMSLTSVMEWRERTTLYFYYTKKFDNR